MYTQTLAHGLEGQGHSVSVFCRKEDPFRPDYELTSEVDPSDPRISLFIVNLPNGRDRYRHAEVDARFDGVLRRIDPAVVHLGHLNHLSTSIVEKASARRIPVVFTLHDYWLMCPRGQFLQANLGGEVWAACDGQEDRRCSVHCYSKYYTGLSDAAVGDEEYWMSWVGDRMRHIRQMVEYVDLFIAPSRYLQNKFVDEFGLPSDKVTYLDYGFDHGRLRGRSRSKENDFVFGYIGTHTVPKGIQVLIEAFGRVEGRARLRIWGRANGQITASLKEMVRNLPLDKRDRVEWCEEYRNEDIVRDVFNNVDALVVPSIWVENSPLVIHEAQQVRVPVITSDLGGMSEYVEHETNGLLFAPRNSDELAKQMQRFVDDPELALRLGRRGYLQSPTGDVPSIETHVKEMLDIYESTIKGRVTIA